MTILLASILRPLLLLFLAAVILLPVRYAMREWFPEGRVKRILLWRLGKD